MFYQHLQVGASIPSLPALPLESFLVKGFFSTAGAWTEGNQKGSWISKIPNHNKATLRLSKHILVLVVCFDDNNLWDLLCVIFYSLYVTVCFRNQRKNGTTYSISSYITRGLHQKNGNCFDFSKLLFPNDDKRCQLMVGRWISIWDGLFPGAMFVLGSVTQKSWAFNNKGPKVYQSAVVDRMKAFFLNTWSSKIDDPELLDPR